MSRRRIALALVTLILVIGGWRQFRDRTTSAATARTKRAGAARPDGQPLVFRDGRWVKVDAADVSRLIARLDDLAPGLLTVRGTVRDAQSQQPMPGVEVVFFGPDGESSATTDDSGGYELHLSAGFYRPFARGEGMLAVGPAIIERLPGPPDPSEVGLPRHLLAPVLGLFEDHDAVDLEVQLGGTVIGRLIDERGQPVVGAVISAITIGDDQERVRTVDGSDLAETDDRGAFRMAVPRGRIGFEIDHPQHAGLSPRSQRMAYVAAGQPVEVELIAAAGCVITGRVVDASGRAVGAGSLELDIGGLPPNDFTPVGRIRADGSFRYGTREGMAIRMRAWPWKSPPSEPQRIDCSHSGARPTVTFLIRSQEPDVTGALVDSSGEPIPGAYVDIIPQFAGGMAQQERTDEQGNFAIYALPAGPYQIAAYVPDRGITVSYLEAPRRGLRLQLQQTGAVRGRIANVVEGRFTLKLGSCLADDEDGEPFAFDNYNMPGIDRIVPVSRGEFQISGLPPCMFLGRATMGSKSLAVGFEISAGGTTAVTWDFDAPEDLFEDDLEVDEYDGHGELPEP